jgi:hypothetical protein
MQEALQDAQFIRLISIFFLEKKIELGVENGLLASGI